MSEMLWGVGISTLDRERNIALNHLFKNVLENMSMATSKKAKSPNISEKEQTAYNYGLHEGDRAGYKRGWDEGYSHALSVNKSPRWQHNGSLIQPGLYVVEDHEGNTKTATFFETTYGTGDTRNDAGFMSEYGDKIKPHLIRRVYGPISPFNAELEAQNGDNSTNG